MAKNSGPVRTVHAPTTGKEREEMIATTRAEIEKKFGQGSIMYGDGGPELEVEAIPTGALALDAALVSAVCRAAVSSRFTVLSPPVRRRFRSRSWPRPRQWVALWHLSMPSTLDPTYAARIGVDIDEVLISQPDTGEQALEIVDMFVVPGAIDAIVVDRRRADPACRDRWRNRRHYGRSSRLA